MALYTFNGFDENELAPSGSLSVGDTFTMPAAYTREFQVTDNDDTLSGDDDGDNESADSSQYAEVYDDGGLERSGTIYIDESFTLEDANGNVYRAYQLEVEGTSQDYIVFATPAPPAGTYLTVTANDNDPNPAPYGSLHDQPPPVCFARGTWILTPNGERLIERLRPGDLVTTRDSEPAPILWIGKQILHLFPGRRIDKPVLIRPSALSPNTPSRPLVLSSQHRVMVAGPSLQRIAGMPQAIVAAKFLTTAPGIRFKYGQKRVTYFHILTKRHMLVRANGAWCETMLPRKMALQSLDAAARHAVMNHLPELRRDPVNGYGPPVRPILTKKTAQAFISRLRPHGWLVDETPQRIDLPPAA